jgi:HK97 family phage major capsid protein
MDELKNPIMTDAAAALQKAFETKDEKAISQAWNNFAQAIVDKVQDDAEQCKNDRDALARRGYRILTSAEEKFYNGIIQASKSANPMQAYTSLIDIEMMPETIITDVYKNLVNEHPLLNAISFTNVSYMTKWLLNDHTKAAASWGEINSEITKEIGSSFKTMEMTQCKLSCFTAIPLDMLELAPTFLDAYIRTILTESIAISLEAAIISGTGKNMPIGLDRDISASASVVGGEYPAKEAVKVTNFKPETYGPLVAKLTKTEKGVYRKINAVAMAVNPTDYYAKVMPATTVQNANGTYIGNVFPVPTNVYQSAELEEGKAILFIPQEYFMGLGSSKSGTITYSDDFKFLEDARTWKIKLYANGRAYDNTVAIVLDISDLEPLYITVLNKSATPEA